MQIKRREGGKLMTENEIKLVVGSLLHDVGKVIYRTGNIEKHSLSGAKYLMNEAKVDDKSVIDCVKYHHSDALKNANLDRNSLAYITYIADNIASASDRRDNGSGDYGFTVTMPLAPVFNILNKNNSDCSYAPRMLNSKINYPTKDKIPFDKSFYSEVKDRLNDTLKGLEWNENYLNSLLLALESTMYFVPSSTSKSELADISLYDHVKLTSAYSSCIYQYLSEQGIVDFKDELFKNANSFYEKNAFLLYEMDISGIQDFIYTIHSKDALRTLRSRSFYLEIFMQHIVDTLLSKLSLSRANLIYSGGGHCYMILPNTDSVKSYLDEYEREINSWLMKNFDISLYVATAYKEASANTFKNIPEESYKTLFRSVSNQLSDKKLNRYSSADILYLNHKSRELYDRECRVCKRLGKVNEDDLCSFCSSIKKLSNSILYNDFFVVVDKYEENSVPLPDDNYLLGENEGDLRERMKNNNYIRVYSINKPFTGKNIANVIWLANYTNGQTFEELAKASEGIKRIAVLRADVDNLGQAFVQGFSEKYNTLSRTATLSRQLSIFFTKYLKEILDKDYSCSLKKEAKKKNATVVYSGGDDVFIVGAWNEVIELAVDIKNSFEKYTENTLTFSAGIGLYSSSYPISRIAYEVGSLEDKSKKLPNKNAITLFDDGCSHKEQDISILDGTYHWEEFVNEVVREKFDTLDKFFSLQNKKDQDTERGNAFLYKILELIRGREEKIHFVRLVYLLSRLEPKYDSKDKENSLKKIQAYKEFSSKVLKWYDNEKDSRQLKTAINMFVYYNRNSERKENE